ncbi:methyltransferase domain-containing protein [Streptomyces goshikiensis]|uniref:hypothetical protein n=1 Tax=Streptomyces goshikiensis TaxID=1942 RepID=UPI0036CE814C
MGDRGIVPATSSCHPPVRRPGGGREFKRRGATEVLGVDISAGERAERREPLGVRYEVGDVAELRPLERRFDISVGVQCLN